MKNKTTKHACEICGKTEMLESKKRHWCDCNPTAPFFMWNVRHQKMARKVLAGFGIR